MYILKGTVAKVYQTTQNTKPKLFFRVWLSEVIIRACRQCEATIVADGGCCKSWVLQVVARGDRLEVVVGVCR